MPATLLICDTLQAVEAARMQFPDGIVVSDNPLLAPVVPGLVDMSATLGQVDATALGEAGIDALLELDRILPQAGVREVYSLLAARLNVTIAMRATVSTLLQKGVMLSRLLCAQTGISEVVVAGMPETIWQESHPWLMGRFAPAADTLARHGFFGKRRIHRLTIEVTQPELVGDVPTDDLLSRAMITPWSVLAHEALRRLLPRRRSGGRALYVGKSAENLREALPWLAARGFDLRPLDLPRYRPVSIASAAEAARRDNWLASHALPLFKCIKAGFGENEEQAFTSAALEYLDAGLRSTAASVPGIVELLDRVAAEAVDPAILTGGIYGPLATNFHKAAMDRRIPLIDFEHGATTGIARTAQRRLAVSEATTSDLLIVGAPRAARAFSEANGTRNLAVVGMPDQTRHLFRRRLQAWRARKRLGIGSRDEVIMHVSGFVYGGNVRFGDDAPIEALVARHERQLITDVYGHLSRKVLYKPYPAVRMPYQPTIEQRLPIASNVVPVPREDFRYIRAAADILVSEASMSTLGWCLGCDVPFIHLQSRHVNVLADDALQQQFARAFFVIDIDEDGWAEKLRALLRQPLDSIWREWTAKRTEREVLLQDAFFGPAGNMGRRAAREVVRYLSPRDVTAEARRSHG